MKKFLFSIIAFLPVFAFAQSTAIVSTQTDLNGLVSPIINGALCTGAAATRWTGWIKVVNQRNIVFDVDFLDANASAASLDVTCETSRSTATAQGAGRTLPVIWQTSTTGTVGVSSMSQSLWRWLSTSGGAPGTSAFPLYIENIPAPLIACLFTCGAGGAAADTITVFARGINP